MADAKRMKLSVSFNNLPPEMVEKILKLLNVKKICQVRVICKQWKEIIDNGNLLKKASGSNLFEPFNYLVKSITYLIFSDFNAFLF